MSCRGDVLLADDQETFRESTADLLRNEGYRCDIVADANEAGRLLHSSRYDVLISDIRMPGNAGLEFVGSLKETAAGMPIILVTGYPSLTSAVYAVQLPVIAYLIKPFDFNELLPFVQTAVERSTAYRTIFQSRQRLEGLSEALRQVENALCDSTGLPGPGATEAASTPASDSPHTGPSCVLRVDAAGPGQTNLPGMHDLSEELDRTRAVLKEAVHVLEQSKSAFKSKRLGQLRRQLEDVVNRVRD